MRITDLRTLLVELPGTTWIVSPGIRSFGCLLVFLDTDEGFTGQSFLWTFGTRRLNLLNSTISSIKDSVIGEDPHYTKRIWHKVSSEMAFFNGDGIAVFCNSAINRACWDALGKAAGKPVYKLLGAYRDEVPVYASGLWLHTGPDELVEDAHSFINAGHRAIKMRIGKPRIEEDVERVQLVRETVGPDIRLMVDANQRLTVDHAIKLGRKLERLDIAWFEEPVPAHDFDGLAQVAAALDVPVASGENISNCYGFRRIIEQKASDFLMPDLICIGGVDQFLKVAHMAEAYGISITPHVLAEESLHMAACTANATYVEIIDWFSLLYEEKIAVRDGRVVLPQRPGFGSAYDENVLDRFRIA